LLSVSPDASRGRTALTGSSRFGGGGNVHNVVGSRGEHGEPRVRQNRVVLAVVATVKLLRRRRSRQPARRRRIPWRRGRPEGTRLPGERGI